MEVIHTGITSTKVTEITDHKEMAKGKEEEGKSLPGQL